MQHVFAFFSPYNSIKHPTEKFSEKGKIENSNATGSQLAHQLSEQTKNFVSSCSIEQQTTWNKRNIQWQITYNYNMQFKVLRSFASCSWISKLQKATMPTMLTLMTNQFLANQGWWTFHSICKVEFAICITILWLPVVLPK